MRGLALAVVLAALSLSCASDEEEDDGPTKDEVQSKADWSEDYCETEGWYSDGVCDEFCPNPDPECGPSGGKGGGKGGGGKGGPRFGGSTYGGSTYGGSAYGGSNL